MLFFIFVIQCGMWSNMFKSFLSLVYICIVVRDGVIQWGGLGSQSSVSPPHVGACSKTGPEFPTSYVVVHFFVFKELM